MKHELDTRTKYQAIVNGMILRESNDIKSLQAFVATLDAKTRPFVQILPVAKEEIQLENVEGIQLLTE